MTVHDGGSGTGTYEFSSKPRPVKVRSKLRQEDLRAGSSQGMRPEAMRHGAARPEGGSPDGGRDEFMPVNIHHDPRVARGNTFAGDRRGGTPPATTTTGEECILGRGGDRVLFTSTHKTLA